MGFDMSLAVSQYSNMVKLQWKLAWREWALPSGKEPSAWCPLPRWQGSGMACQDQALRIHFSSQSDCISPGASCVDERGPGPPSQQVSRLVRYSACWMKAMAMQSSCCYLRRWASFPPSVMDSRVPSPLDWPSLSMWMTRWLPSLVCVCAHAARMRA